jgi:hypothetical protein
VHSGMQQHLPASHGAALHPAADACTLQPAAVPEAAPASPMGSFQQLLQQD